MYPMETPSLPLHPCVQCGQSTWIAVFDHSGLLTGYKCSNCEPAAKQESLHTIYSPQPICDKYGAPIYHITLEDKFYQAISELREAINRIADNISREK